MKTDFAKVIDVIVEQYTKASDKDTYCTRA